MTIGMEHISFVVVIAKWQEWGPWSECSDSCGNGFQERKRSCIDPEFGVVDRCLGESTETKVCILPACPGYSFLYFFASQLLPFPSLEL